MEEKNIITSFCEKSKSASGRVQQFHRALHKQTPFYDLLEEVKEQIEISCFDSCDKRQAQEIALIIAEIHKLPETAYVRIAGNDLPVDMVSLVFDRIEHDHVVEVIRHYREAKYEIKHTKTYLRTALYNSVFEMEARIDNEVQKDMYGN